MSLKTVWYDETTGRVKGSEPGDVDANKLDHPKALAETDDVGEITLDHVVTVIDGQVTDATLDPPEVPPEVRRRNLHQYLAQLGRRRRLALVGRSPDDPDVDSAEMMLQVEQAMLQNKRETGRSSAGENARLDDELEPLAISMLAEWQAQQAIKPKIDDDTYTTEADIDGAAEWPS